MIVGAHQPYFLPWPGFLHKMASCDKFIILDEVQLEDRSPMLRNVVLNHQGDLHTLCVNINKKGYRDKKNREITLNYDSNWNENLLKFLYMNYKKAPFFDEIYPSLQEVIGKKYTYLIEQQMEIIELFRNWFDIKTPLIYQSSLSYDSTLKNSDLMLALVKAVGGDTYHSGTGAKAYINEESFQNAGVKLLFQKFTYPTYKQFNTKEFVPNLSALDMLFNCGIKASCKLLRETIK